MNERIQETAHFSMAELRCKCGCDYPGMDAEFMRQVELLRRALGEPMRVTSGYRCPTYNAQVSTTGLTGPHTTGRAMDIAIAGEPAFRALTLAIEVGMRGIGLRQHDPWAGRFMHIDNLEGETRPRIWTYA